MILPKLTQYSELRLSPIIDCHAVLQELLSQKSSATLPTIEKPVILYGAGNLGQLARDFFVHLGIPFLYAVDINADDLEMKKKWKGYKLVMPDKVPDEDKKNALLIVCIVTSPLIPLRKKLLEEGWIDVAFFYDISAQYRHRHPLNNGWLSKNFTSADSKHIKKVFDGLIDKASRAHYLQFLAWRKFRTELSFQDSPVQKEDRFFIPEVKEVLKRNERFLDCGAHHGHTIKAFIRNTDGLYDSIMAIEPDSENLVFLRKNMKYLKKIELLSCALSNRGGKRRFYEGFDYASRLDPKGNTWKVTKSIDSIHISPTFVKIHVEGEELSVLRGALATIDATRPIIAATLYHNSDGLWEIPFFLMNRLKKYRYYFRLHSWAGTGAVFYALPEERVRNSNL